MIILWTYNQKSPGKWPFLYTPLETTCNIYSENNGLRVWFTPFEVLQLKYIKKPQYIYVFCDLQPWKHKVQVQVCSIRNKFWLRKAQYKPAWHKKPTSKNTLDSYVRHKSLLSLLSATHVFHYNQFDFSSKSRKIHKGTLCRNSFDNSCELYFSPHTLQWVKIRSLIYPHLAVLKLCHT